MFDATCAIAVLCLFSLIFLAMALGERSNDVTPVMCVATSVYTGTEMHTDRQPDRPSGGTTKSKLEIGTWFCSAVLRRLGRVRRFRMVTDCPKFSDETERSPCVVDKDQQHERRPDLLTCQSIIDKCQSRACHVGENQQAQKRHETTVHQDLHDESHGITYPTDEARQADMRMEAGSARSISGEDRTSPYTVDDARQAEMQVGIGPCQDISDEDQRRTHVIEELQQAAMRREIVANQRKHTLTLTFDELQHLIGRSMTAKYHNQCFSPIIRLPEELLLCIINVLVQDDDLPALLSLRRASNTFYRILDRQSGWWEPRSSLKQSKYGVKWHRWGERDIRVVSQCVCYKSCRRTDSGDRNPRCRFDLPYVEKQFCKGCRSLHNSGEFSSRIWSSSADPERQICLGRQGKVRLCEHVNISWNDIESALQGYRQQGHTPAPSKKESFVPVAECCHPSHRHRCCQTDAEHDSVKRPLAFLSASSLDGNGIILQIRWRAYGVVDASILETGGRTAARDMRKRLEEGIDLRWPAGPLPSTSLCEHAYFDGTTYKKKAATGHAMKMSIWPFHSSPKVELTWPSRQDQFNTNTDAESLSLEEVLYGCRIHRNPVAAGATMRIVTHELRGSEGSTKCLSLLYDRQMFICKRAALMETKMEIEPTSDWLHALDPATFVVD